MKLKSVTYNVLNWPDSTDLNSLSVYCVPWQGCSVGSRVTSTGSLSSFSRRSTVSPVSCQTGWGVRWVSAVYHLLSLTATWVET